MAWEHPCPVTVISSVDKYVEKVVIHQANKCLPTTSIWWKQHSRGLCTTCDKTEMVGNHVPQTIVP